MFIAKARQDKRHQGLQDICSLKNVKHIKNTWDKICPYKKIAVPLQCDN